MATGESLTEEEIDKLEELAESGEPWADAVAAYLSALEEVEG